MSLQLNDKKTVVDVGKYAENVFTCPYCGRQEVAGQDTIQCEDADKAGQWCMCLSQGCERQWKDLYQLIGIHTDTGEDIYVWSELVRGLGDRIKSDMQKAPKRVDLSIVFDYWRGYLDALCAVKIITEADYELLIQHVQAEQLTAIRILCHVGC